MVVSVLLEIKFRHAQINVPKIGIPMLKTACINPCQYTKKNQNSFAQIIGQSLYYPTLIK